MQLQSDCLRTRNILLTGASRGLGRAIAGVFWKYQANLFLVARSAAQLDELRAQLSARAAEGQRVHVVPADLARPGEPARILEAVRRQASRLDGLVNNAAILGPIGPLWENDWAAWQTSLQVNLLAPIELCRLAVPWMGEAGGGSIVNLSGGGATGPRPFFTAYGTAKAALVRFTETLARETAPLGIRVNSIAPGAMNTEMNDAVLRAGPALAGADEYNRATRQASQGGASPETAAELAAFLVSDASAGISGRLLSALWDPWRELPAHAGELRDSDIYTLRRIVPEDRGKKWL